MQVPPSMPAMQKFHASWMHGRFLVPPFDISSQHKCHAARKIVFSFSTRPEKMVFTKKSRWNIIFLVLLRKIMFLFLENIILTLGGKWQMIFFKKNTRKYDIFFRSSEKKVFSKRAAPGHDLSFIMWKDGFFFPKTIFFLWAGSQRWRLSRNTWKYDIFCVQCGCYKPDVTPPCLKKSRMALSRKNTPKGDWCSRWRSWKELHQFPVPSQRPLQAFLCIALQRKKTENLICRIEFDLFFNLFGWRFSTMNNLQYFVPFSPHEPCLWVCLCANKINYLSIRRWVIIPKM